MTKYIFLIISRSPLLFCRNTEKKILIKQLYSLLEITFHFSIILEVEVKYSKKETEFMFSGYTNLKLAPLYPGQIVYQLRVQQARNVY